MPVENQRPSSLSQGRQNSAQVWSSGISPVDGNEGGLSCQLAQVEVPHFRVQPHSAGMTANQFLRRPLPTECCRALNQVGQQLDVLVAVAGDCLSCAILTTLATSRVATII